MTTGFDLSQVLAEEVASARSSEGPLALSAAPAKGAEAGLLDSVAALSNPLFAALGNASATRSTTEFLATLALQDSLAVAAAIASSSAPATGGVTPPASPLPASPSQEPGRTVQVAQEALSETATPTTQTDQTGTVAASAPDLAGEAALHFGANATATLPTVAAEPGREKRATAPVSAVPASEGLQSWSESANPGTYSFLRSRTR
jgi:hypothetical protein